MSADALDALVRAEDAVAMGLSTADMLGELGPVLMPGHPKAVLAGRSCGFPQVYPVIARSVHAVLLTAPYACYWQAWSGAMHAILTAQGEFVHGVRQNLLAGGDSCCRAGFVGAVLAALGGSMDAMPQSWRDRI
eukprot:COSAG01_NODE_17105_length_1178_cov_1.533828_3_plen_134_part_00